ncbi:carbohydrate ABC transporter permease [Kribbella sp. CA-294648]|uniref:carbohydrate ABC transporter permease n=1 Tax=Kribbella sp. CA-294648 TaxID=3239948 RepID=UPI003D9163BF
MTTVTQRPSAAEPEPVNRAPKRRNTLRGQENRAGLTLVSPTFLIVLVVVVLPILWTVVLAFQNVRLVDIQSQGLFGNWTLRNLDRVFSSPGFWSSLWTTVVYTIGSTLGSILVGLIAALALRKPFRGRFLIRGAMLLPYVAPVVAVAFVWQVLLSPDLGVVNHWGVNVFGWDRPIAFLTQRSYEVAGVPVPMALLTVIGFEIWRYFPFAFLFLLARLQAVPAVLEEAAVVDGTTPWQRFRFILLPQLLPVIALLSVLRFIMTFNKFDDVYLLTGGGAGTDVVAVRVYRFLTARFDVGLASAQAVVLAAVLIVLLGLYFKFFGRRVQEEQS